MSEFSTRVPSRVYWIPCCHVLRRAGSNCLNSSQLVRVICCRVRSGVFELLTASRRVCMRHRRISEVNSSALVANCRLALSDTGSATVEYPSKVTRQSGNRLRPAAAPSSSRQAASFSPAKRCKLVSAPVIHPPHARSRVRRSATFHLIDCHPNRCGLFL